MCGQLLLGVPQQLLQLTTCIRPFASVSRHVNAHLAASTRPFVFNLYRVSFRSSAAARGVNQPLIRLQQDVELRAKRDSPTWNTPRVCEETCAQSYSTSHAPPAAAYSTPLRASPEAVVYVQKSVVGRRRPAPPRDACESEAAPPRELIPRVTFPEI